MNIKTDDEIGKMRIAGSMVGRVHNLLEDNIKIGISTLELDKLAYEKIISMGATPSFKGFNGFPASICVSVNDEVVHGIPSDRTLKNGDIVSIDIGVCYEGYHGDSAWTYPVGDVSNEVLKLLKVTEESLFRGLSSIKNGCHVGDIGYAISNYVRPFGYGVIRELVGHGVGSELHEKPDVPNYGKKGIGPILKTGMVIAVEPMINLGARTISILEDEWTIVTNDELPSAHFEHTVLVLYDGYEILTKR